MEDGSIQIPSRTIDFIMQPREIPSPEALGEFDDYLAKCREYMESLIQKALQEDALPNRTRLVQCVAKSPHEHADLTYPVILCGGHQVTKRAFAGLAYVTSFLESHPGSSSHERARKFGDTTKGNIVVFTNAETSPYQEPLQFPCNLITIGLEAERETAIGFCDEMTQLMGDMGFPLIEAETWRVQLQDHIGKLHKNSAFQTGKQIANETRFSQAFSADFKRKQNGSESKSDLTRLNDSEPQNLTMALHDNILSDAKYLDRVAVLTQFGQVVLCMPQVVRFHSGGGPQGSDTAVFDSGLTMFLEGDPAPTQEELLQIFVVSRSLASFHASLSGVVSRVTDAVRQQVADEAMSALKHSASNSLTDIAALSGVVAPEANLLKHTMAGAVAFARREATPIVLNEVKIPWGHLGSNGGPLEEDIQKVFFATKECLTMTCRSMNNVIVDARTVLLVEELARNLCKGPRNAPGLIEVCANDSQHPRLAISVEGFAKITQLEAIYRRLTQLSRGVLSSCFSFRGLKAVALVVDALSTCDTSAYYIFGETGLVAFKNRNKPDHCIGLPRGSEIKFWGIQELRTTKKKSTVRMLMQFDNLSTLGTK